MKKGKIFFVIGPTAAGKTVIVNYILTNRPKTTRAVSYTTREKREGEVNAKDYFFVTKKEFKKLIKDNKFIEYSEVYGNLYGTTKESFKAIEKGYDVIKIIDFQGAKKFKESGIEAIYLFFAPKDIATLRQRLEKRGDKDIDERLKVYQEELRFKKECDYYIDTSGIENSDIKNCAIKVMKIIDSFKNK